MIFKKMLSKKRTGKNTKQNASTIDITHPAIAPIAIPIIIGVSFFISLIPHIYSFGAIALKLNHIN